MFGCEKFHTYLFGRQFTVTSDHKPLEIIMTKPLHAVPLRLQKMRIRLQSYDLKVVYKPGKSIPLADALSRHFNEADEFNANDDYTACVDELIADLPVSNNIIESMKSETNTNDEMKQIKRHNHSRMARHNL